MTTSWPDHGPADRPATASGGVSVVDEIHLNLLPHLWASWTLRGAPPADPCPGPNRQVTVFGSLEVTTGAWVYRLGRRCAGDWGT
jgi:hypothetical protein